MTIPTISALAKLQKTLDDQFALSIYFTARSTNPSQRNTWRAKLKSELRRLSKALANAGVAERRAFDAAREAFEAMDIPELSRADGVACFVTARGVQHVERLPFAVESAVTWGTGVALAPYVRALKQHRPVILAVADGKTAHLYRFQDDQLTELEKISVEPHLHHPTHMSARVGPKFHPGTRGVAGQDESQREWSAATDRMTRQLAQQLAHHAGEDAWVILGGRADVLHRTQEALPKGLLPRTGEASGITVQSPNHELERAARQGASALRDAADARDLQKLTNGGDERHAAAVGENAARRALDNASVARLYLSSRYVAENAERAETAVRSALDQGADIETVSGGASEALDAMGGIAARLRYSTS